jgi:hypothetical protein
VPAKEADSGPMPVVAPGPPRPGPAEGPDRDVLDSARFRLAFHEAIGGAGPAVAAVGDWADRPPADDLSARRRPAGRLPAGPLPAGPRPAGRRPAGRRPAGPLPAGRDPADHLPAIHLPAERAQADLRAVAAVLELSQADPRHPADPLDVGAGLVLLGNLRLHLDRLEAGLLETAEQTGLSWDLIAAIIGIPATEARDRLAQLRARPDPH